jgi:hypothetical protein
MPVPATPFTAVLIVVSSLSGVIGGAAGCISSDTATATAIADASEVRCWAIEAGGAAVGAGAACSFGSVSAVPSMATEQRFWPVLLASL